LRAKKVKGFVDEWHCTIAVPRVTQSRDKLEPGIVIIGKKSICETGNDSKRRKQKITFTVIKLRSLSVYMPNT
jgi:hypothetical protein